MPTSRKLCCHRGKHGLHPGAQRASCALDELRFVETGSTKGGAGCCHLVQSVLHLQFPADADGPQVLEAVAHDSAVQLSSACHQVDVRMGPISMTDHHVLGALRIPTQAAQKLLGQFGKSRTIQLFFWMKREGCMIDRPQQSIAPETDSELSRQFPRIAPGHRSTDDLGTLVRCKSIAQDARKTPAMGLLGDHWRLLPWPISASRARRSWASSSSSIPASLWGSRPR
jgi:hypothetical protein